MCRFSLSPVVLILGALFDGALAVIPAAKRHGVEGARPQPIATPALELLDERLLRKREESSISELAVTVTIAPDATCGYVSASPSSAMTCANGKACMWESGLLNAVICGDGSNALAYLHCLDNDEATNDACDAACKNDEYNLLCTDTSAPYCHTYRYPDDIVDYGCNSRSESRFHSVDFSYSGQSDRELSKSTITEAPSTATNGDPEFYLYSIPISLPTGLIIISPGGDSGGNSSQGSGSGSGSGGNSTSDNGDSSSHDIGGHGSTPKNNTGAIVGGVVGGLAVIALFVLGIFFLRRRSKKAKGASDLDPPAGTLEVNSDSPKGPVQTGWEELPGTTVGPKPDAEGFVNKNPYEVANHERPQPALKPAPVYEMDGGFEGHEKPVDEKAD
ncbi:Fc.00g074260.m01.CDS01 [Cosmosporella sp. VM-42]